MRCGIDVGGTKIETAILSAEGEFLSRERTDTPGNYRALLNAIKKAWIYLLKRLVSTVQLGFVCLAAYQKKQG